MGKSWGTGIGCWKRGIVHVSARIWTCTDWGEIGAYTSVAALQKRPIPVLGAGGKYYGGR